MSCHLLLIQIWIEHVTFPLQLDKDLNILYDGGVCISDQPLQNFIDFLTINILEARNPEPALFGTQSALADVANIRRDTKQARNWLAERIDQIAFVRV